MNALTQLHGLGETPSGEFGADVDGRRRLKARVSELEKS